MLITGATGNLGGLLSRHLVGSRHKLRLMYHKRPLSEDLLSAPDVVAVQADLAHPETVAPAVEDVDTVVHFAGVLFAPWPETFLPETNTVWFSNLVEVALKAGVRKIILISFPHVEGPTNVENPATGRLDRDPVSVHAQTRLEEERILMDHAAASGMTGVILRVGMVYGRGILMVDAARWLARRRLLGVWRQPTWIQLISTPDFLQATQAAIENLSAQGIYHIGDEQPVTLQDFLDTACQEWGYPAPHRMPVWMINTAAFLCELGGSLFRKSAPLTRDFIEIGRVPYWGDTSRARAELIPTLTYSSLETGRHTL